MKSETRASEMTIAIAKHMLLPMGCCSFTLGDPYVHVSGAIKSMAKIMVTCKEKLMNQYVAPGERGFGDAIQCERGQVNKFICD